MTRLYYFRDKRSFMKWCRERKYNEKACEKAWTGPGYYYARSRSHISKHVPHLDKRRGGKEGRGPWRHVHDLERAVRRIRSELRKHVREKAEKRLARRKLPERLREKLVEAAEARAALAAARKAKSWARSKAVRELADYLWRSIPRKYKEGRGRAWTYVAVLALAKAIHDRARELGVDPYQYDWKEIIDWSLGYRYAVDVVRRVMGKTTDEFVREQLERWKRYKELYDVKEALERAERELDDVIRYELEHMDEVLAL